MQTHAQSSRVRSTKSQILICVSVLQDWIEFEEIADLEERAKSQFFEKENEEEVQKNQAAAKEKEFQSVKATKDQVGEVRQSDRTMSSELCKTEFYNRVVIVLH